MTIFLSKFLANAGIASRRKVIDLIKEGLVTVNGSVVKDPAYTVQAKDSVKYKNKLIRSQEKVYILLNKPTNYITTVSDESGRKTVMDLVAHATPARIYPVGRLDRDTSGLLLLTNDGDVAQRLAHPKFNVQKTYAVTLDTPLTDRDAARIKDGLELTDGFIKVDGLFFLSPSRKQIKVILHSGKNRIVRRIFEHCGYHVQKLDRMGYAGLTKKGLRVGQWRFLTASEVKRLV